jgi:diguanylate cyclase (GGDEF)-like protein
MNKFSRKAKAYILIVAFLAGISLLYFSFYPAYRNINIPFLIFFFFFAFAAELYPISLPGQNAFITASIFYYAILLIFGTTPVDWIVFVASVISEFWQRLAWYRIVFNVSQAILSFSIAGFVYDELSGGVLSLHHFTNILGLVLSGFIILFCNAFLLSGVVSLAQNINFWRVWRQQWEAVLLDIFVTFPLGILVALIYFQEPLAVVMLVVPFFIIQYAFKTRTTHQELDKKIQELSLLFEASHYLGTSLSLRRALQVMLDITQRIIPCNQVHVFLLERRGEKDFLCLKATTYPNINPKQLSVEYSEMSGAYALFPRHEEGEIINTGLESKRTTLPCWTPEQQRLVKELYEGEKAGMYVPLRRGESLLGFVEVTNRTSGAYTLEDLKLLSTLANVASVAIKNASIYEDTLDLATKDGLTGLYNHRLFQEFLDKEISRASREGQEMCLILFDIDHFKHFNDTYGHMTGDLVLKEVARIAQSCVREGDIVARYGGEEFAVVLPATPREVGLDVCERLRHSVASEVSVLFSRKMEITISLGLAVFPHDAKDKVGLIRAADSALYHAKALGRNRSVPFSKEIKPVEKERAVIGVERVQSFLMLQIARMLATFLDVRSGVEKGRTDRIAAYAVKLAEKMNLSPEETKILRMAALLHDIGKVALGRKLLRKNGPLTEEEREQIKIHPEVGATLLAQFPIFHRVAAIVCQEQERYDGLGYPLGLAKDEILLSARILSAVRTYCSITTERPFRKALSQEEAIEELKKEAGTQFDPQVIEKFIELLNEEKSQRFA